MAPEWRAFEQGKDGNAAQFLAGKWGAHLPNLAQRILIFITQHSVLQRGGARGQMTRLIMALGRPLDIVFRGCRYRIAGRNNLIEVGLLTRPSYNGTEIDFLHQAMGQGGVAVDIGCNIGLYSLPLAQMTGPAGQVIAIDANPEMVAHLTFNAQASGLENLVPLHVAVGAQETQVDLLIRKNNVAIVSVTESATGATPMRPLLNILADAGVTRLDALKIDIEGHEDMAMVPFLQSAPEALLPAHIVIERDGEEYPGCAAEFARLGYVLAGRTRNNSMYARR